LNHHCSKNNSCNILLVLQLGDVVDAVSIDAELLTTLLTALMTTLLFRVKVKVKVTLLLLFPSFVNTKSRVLTASDRVQLGQ